MFSPSLRRYIIDPINHGVLDRIQSILVLQFCDHWENPQFSSNHVPVNENVQVVDGTNQRNNDEDNVDVVIVVGNKEGGTDTVATTKHPQGLGRIGLISCFLGIQWGIHLCVMVCIIPICCYYLLFVSSPLEAASAAAEATTTNRIPTTTMMVHLLFLPPMIFKIWTWCFYVTAMCTFHLLEFFVTCMYNPTVASSESFLINHSKAYTAAALMATIEFWIRYFYMFLSLEITTTSTTSI